MPVHVPRNPRLPDTFTPRPRAELRVLAFQPVRRNRGTDYPCTESELRDAITPSRQPRSSTISPIRASYEVFTHNARGRNLSGAEYNAIRRLEDVMLDVFAGRIDYGPDLIVKTFCDLDRVFFLGRLRGQVHVKWTSGSSFPARRPHRLYYGRADYLGGGKVVIRLNADGIFATTRLSTFKEMWRTMLHEMCHAYEFIQVASHECEDNEHGRHFGTKIRAVHERASREIHVGAMDSSESYNTYTFEPVRRR